MLLQVAITEFLTEIEIRKYTPKTIKGYRINLGAFQRYCEGRGIQKVSEITLATVRQFAQHYVKMGRKGTYINGILKCVKSFLQYCYDEGYGAFDTKGKFKWVKEEKPVILTFKPSQVKALIASCGGLDYLSIRDKAVLTMLFETGIRCYELCCLTPEDIHDEFIIINGKNHKQRVVPITPVLKKALLKHDAAKQSYFYLIKKPDNYLFVSFHGYQLTNSAVEHILKRRAEGIDMGDVRVSPHTCRHFYAQQQLKMGTDIYTISRLLGHENIHITQVYLRSLSADDLIEETKHSSVLMNL